MDAMALRSSCLEIDKKQKKTENQYSALLQINVVANSELRFAMVQDCFMMFQMQMSSAWGLGLLWFSPKNWFEKMRMVIF